MARGFAFSHTTHPGIPLVQHYPVKTGEAFTEGGLVVLDANGELTECAADAVSILGVAAAAAFHGRGWELANASQIQQVTGRDAYCPVYLGVPTNIFTCRLKNSTTDPVTPLATHVDEQYGVGLTSHVFYLDLDETSAKSFEIVGINADELFAYVKMISTVFQL